MLVFLIKKTNVAIMYLLSQGVITSSLGPPIRTSLFSFRKFFLNSSDFVDLKKEISCHAIFGVRIDPFIAIIGTSVFLGTGI